MTTPHENDPGEPAAAPSALTAASILVPGGLAAGCWVVGFFVATVGVHVTARVPRSIGHFVDATTIVTALLLAPLFVISLRAWSRSRRGAARGEVLGGVARFVPHIMVAAFFVGLVTGARSARSSVARDVSSATLLCVDVLGSRGTVGTPDACIDAAIRCERERDRRSIPTAERSDDGCVRERLSMPARSE